MADVKDPESLEKVKSVKINQDVVDFVTELDQRIEEEKGNRSEWEGRVDNYTRKRYGIRQKKSFPWVGAANFVLPQIDSDINRLKPSYVNLAYGVSPIVSFEPFGPEDVAPARKREILFDWRMRTQVKFFNPYTLGVDYMLHNGFTLFKTGWRFELTSYYEKLDLADLPQQVLEALYLPEVDDATLFHILAEEIKVDLTLEENVEEIQKVVGEFREGKTKFEMEFMEKAVNRAEVIALNPRDEVVFPINTTDIQEATFVDHRFTKSKNQIRLAMKQGKYKKYDDYEIDSWRSKSFYGDTSESVKARRDGVTLNHNNEDEILLHEVSTWYDINNDGIDERVIVTYPDSNPSIVLRFIENPYDHGMFPYVVVRRELNDSEIISSRGIPALDDDFQTGISTLLNQDIDAGTISTTPTIVARKNSVKNLRNLRYVPGQVVETENGPADYAVTQNPNLGQASRFLNMQYLKSWANDRIGNVSAALSQTNNMPGSGIQGTKTAKEVGVIAASGGQVQSLDLQVFQQQISDLYYQIDSLYYQFGDEQEELAITGQPYMRISRAEIRGKFNMVPNGKLDNSDPTVRANKSAAIFRSLVNDPFIRQDQLRKLFLDDMDVRLSQLLMKSPEEMQRDSMMSMQGQNDQLRTALLMQKAKDQLEIQKEAALVPIQGRKYATE